MVLMFRIIHLSDGLGPGSWSRRGMIGCELLLSISCDTRVKISNLRKSLENKSSA